MYDSHCHLDAEAFDADRDEVMARARAAGVTRLLVPGVSPDEWPKLATLRARYPEVRIAVGLHPQALPELSTQQIADGMDALARTARELSAAAIGECGFDRATADRGVGYDVQARIYDGQVEVARALGLPIVLHVLHAQEEALRVLARHGKLAHGGVVHSYSGPAELVSRYVELGFYVSFAGAITRPRAKKPALACRAVPAERLLVETDAPDQTPTGAVTQRCEPAHLSLTVEAVVHARGETVESILRTTQENALRLFG